MSGEAILFIGFSAANAGLFGTLVATSKKDKDTGKPNFPMARGIYAAGSLFYDGLNN